MMNNFLFGLFLIIGISCSNDPSPVYVNPMLGTWQIENSGVTITFDVFEPTRPNRDTILMKNTVMKYLGKTGYSAPNAVSSFLFEENGVYRFYLNTYLGGCSPYCGLYNAVELNGLIPNDEFTEMIGRESDPNAINYPRDGSWVGITGYDGTTNPSILIFKDPIVLKKIKGPD
jgi:hypothetical protein